MKKPNMSNINKPKNILIKARKSTSPFSNTLSDPMNSLQNTYLKEKRINMIIIPIYWIRKPRTKLKHWRKYMNILEN